MSAPTRKKWPRIVVAIVAVLAVIGGGIALHSSAASAATPVYPVMNTSEYPPDGVYFRASPNWADAVRIGGFGIYAGDRVQLQCYAHGTNVQRRDGGSNVVWYIAHNVTRPTAAGRTNTGWVNAHFVNDGTGPNQVAPGVAPCGGNAPPVVNPPAPQSLPEGGAVYFQPRWTDGDPYPPDSVKTIKPAEWAHSTYPPRSKADCPSDRVDDHVPATYKGKRVTTMGGWSVGARLGPVYMIEQNFERAKGFNFIVMYDPGSHANFYASDACDQFYDQAGALAKWLRASPNNVLMVLAGKDTYDPALVSRRGSHQGIQQKLFPGIRDTGLARQVYVCNYNTMSHPNVMWNFRDVMANGRTTNCPGSGVIPWQPHPDPYNLNWRP